MGVDRSGQVIERARVHANGAVTSYLELRCERDGWSTLRYWIDELSGLEERGDRRDFGADESAARDDYAVRAHEGLTTPVPVSTATSLLDPALRFGLVVEQRRSPDGLTIELRRGPEGWAVNEGTGARVGDGWSLWGEEERAAADTFRRLAAGLAPMPPLADVRLHRYPELVERRDLGPEGGVDCSLELRRGRAGWAIVELREYPRTEGWAPERIEWTERADEASARAHFASRSRRPIRS
jgi:hypothetical protein